MQTSENQGCMPPSDSKLALRKSITLRGLLLPAGLFFSACASSSVQRVGTASYAPVSPDANVVVFTDVSHVKEPYEVVEIISCDNPGKYQVLTLGDAIEPLKPKAREIGVNGIIIDKST
jgi:hypothetical protein